MFFPVLKVMNAIIMFSFDFVFDPIDINECDHVT